MQAVPVSLADLPHHHPGGMVLDRCFRAAPLKRDRNLVSKEYVSDKYAAALTFAKNRGDRDPLAVRLDEFRHDAGAEWCYSRDDQLFRAPLEQVQNSYDDLMIERIAGVTDNARTVVETGCGYGFNLWRLREKCPGLQFIGGDIAETAVELADYLFTSDSKISVRGFDYYDTNYSIFDASDAPVVVMTCHSIEQLPSAKSFIKGLEAYADKISRVIHFEPIYEAYGASLLDRLRRAYADAMDYNRDLLTLLEENENIVVEAVEPKFFGINPLNPTTCIQWSFR